MNVNDLIAGMRLLEKDHSPDGWPAVQMQDITRLCDRIAVLEAENKTMRLAAETLVSSKTASTEEEVKRPGIMSAPVAVPCGEVGFRVVQLGPGMRRLDWLNDDWWSRIPAGDYWATFQPKVSAEQQAAGDKAAELAPQINHVISGLKEQMKIDSGHPVSTAG